MDIEHVRQEYPHIVHLFKNSHFPPEISRGLALALDDFGDRPIIVRSSSLLEDRIGSSFAGKYKSLFLRQPGHRARSGSRPSQDAIAEVYASIFGPDPIEYRAERGLLDVHEEMGIMIQEVVGKRVGHYFLPAFSGRRLQPQRVPLVRPHPRARTACCAWSPASAPAPWTGWATTTRSCSRPGSPGCGST